jgi:hypothetical protein
MKRAIALGTLLIAFAVAAQLSSSKAELAAQLTQLRLNRYLHPISGYEGAARPQGAVTASQPADRFSLFR